MDGRLIQALRLLMDMTLSELDGVTSPAVKGENSSEQTTENSRFDPVRFEAFKQGQDAQRTRDEDEPAPRTDRTADREEPGITGGRDGQTIEGRFFERLDEPVEAEVFDSESRKKLPDSLMSKGVEPTVRTSEHFFAPSDKPSPALSSPRPYEVNGRLTLQDISDHFEQDARRY